MHFAAPHKCVCVYIFGRIKMPGNGIAWHGVVCSSWIKPSLPWCILCMHIYAHFPPPPLNSYGVLLHGYVYVYLPPHTINIGICAAIQGHKQPRRHNAGSVEIGQFAIHSAPKHVQHYIYIYNHFPFGCHFASRPYIYIVYIMVCMPCHGESGEYRFSCLGWNAHQSVLFLGLCFYDIVCPGAKWAVVKGFRVRKNNLKNIVFITFCILFNYRNGKQCVRLLKAGLPSATYEMYYFGTFSK